MVKQVQVVELIKMNTRGVDKNKYLYYSTIV